MQGYGLFMMEQLIHSPDGVLFTRGPGAYKIPAFGDIPDEFNVSLLRGASNPKAVRSLTHRFITPHFPCFNGIFGSASL